MSSSSSDEAGEESQASFGEGTVAADVTQFMERGKTVAGDSVSRNGDFELGVGAEIIPERLGEYAIESLIGAGGMGRVYRAEHRWMARTVALKTLAADRMGDERAVQRFYAEVRAAARLLHPNIVTAFDAGQADGMHYLAMEFVDGKTLSEKIHESGPMAVSEAIRIIRGAAAGLAAAHEAGIVHRDVKPGNIMVSKDGTVKVLDLGLATIRSEDIQGPSKRGRLVGTFQYIAPEQLEDPDSADQRADIYSLGATFYYLLAGRSPYSGDMLEQLRQHRDSSPPDLFSVRHDVDLRLDHIFQKMMAKRPQDRYGTMQEMLEDLDHWEKQGGNPSWLAGIVPSPVSNETPTTSGESTSTSTHYAALGIDLGMSYLSASIAEPSGMVEPLSVGESGGLLLRTAVSDFGGNVLYGDAAMAHRVEHPQDLVHSLLLYLGQSRVDRKLFGKQVPPEALLALLLRKVRSTGWKRPGRPTVVALTVPACYDQLHRRSVLNSAKLAGFHSVRLVDRALAAAQSQLDPKQAGAPLPDPSEVQYWLVASLSGSATEATVLKHWGGRFQTLANAGTWLTGTLTWQRRMVDLIAQQYKAAHGVDPRDRLRDVSRLQDACEQVMKDLLLRSEVSISLRAGGRERMLRVTREMLVAVGDEVVTTLLGAVGDTISQAGLTTDRISRVLLVGSMTRLTSVRAAIDELLGDAVDKVPVDRRMLSQGAAMAAAGELPGRSEIAHPPQAATSYDLGLLAYAGGDPHPRTLPVIPRGTLLPARTGRRLTIGKVAGQKGPQTITVVESAGLPQRQWRSLGTHPLPQADQPVPLEAVYEVDLDGLLTVRIRNALTGTSQKLPELPLPTLDAQQLGSWTRWVEETTGLR